MLRIALLALLLPCVLCACQSTTQPKDPASLEDARAQLFDTRGDNTVVKEPEGCKHVWRQIGMHPYSYNEGGLITRKMCVITRCDLCGEVQHECERHLRNAERRKKQRTPRGLSSVLETEP